MKENEKVMMSYKFKIIENKSLNKALTHKCHVMDKYYNFCLDLQKFYEKNILDEVLKDENDQLHELYTLYKDKEKDKEFDNQLKNIKKIRKEKTKEYPVIINFGKLCTLIKKINNEISDTEFMNVIGKKYKLPEKYFVKLFNYFVEKATEFNKRYDLKDVPSKSLLLVIGDLDFAYKMFFKNITTPAFWKKKQKFIEKNKTRKKKIDFNDFGKPKFKRWNEYLSFSIDQVYRSIPKKLNMEDKNIFGMKSITLHNGKTSSVQIPNLRTRTGGKQKKAQYNTVKFIQHRPMKGKIKTLTISKDLDGWYISFTSELGYTYGDIEKDYSKEYIGIDLGIKKSISTSKGKTYILQSKLKPLYERKKREQLKLSKKVVHSNNWYKQKKKLDIIDMKIKKSREYFNHNMTTELIDEYNIVMEDLKPSNLISSAKGNMENKGKNVKAKSGLNRELANVALGQVMEMLKYKADYKGRDIILVDPKNTSRTCNKCGHVDKNNRYKEGFKCTKCGHVADADINASKNILKKGMKKEKTA